VIYTRDDLRPKPSYPTYPPYHVGDYIEDYFYNWFVQECKNISRDYIAISWTTLYCENKDPEIQHFLNSLNPNGKYFTVCQHDDAPKHKLPENTQIFSLSRSRFNFLNPNPIPIPAVCYPVPKQPEVNKDIFASFVGSFTHPLRISVLERCKNEKDYYLSAQQWNPKVNNEKMQEFLHVTNRSKFVLCPRGYGNTSFRMYEAMQMGAIPVYISDDFYLPWSDEINWNEICVLVTVDKINELPDILKNISDEQYNNMQNKIKQIYDQYFTLEGTCKNIVKRIK
jgi:hypothetical protein